MMLIKRHSLRAARLLSAFAAFLWGSLALAAQCPLDQGQQQFRFGTTAKPSGLLVPETEPSGDYGPRPLVILLHGSGATGEAMLRDSKLAQTAQRHGFLLAYPDAGIPAGQGFVWNIPGIPTVTGEVPGPMDRDDTAYLVALADALVAAGCADPARIYATGLSGGGRMASWLGCTVPARFAAIAPVVGLRAGNPSAEDRMRPDPETCEPDAPIAVVSFAGLKDNTNPIAGDGGDRWGYSMHAAEQRWAQLNRCTEAPTTRWIEPGLYEERYGGCAQGTEVISRVSVDGAHSWVVDNEAMWQALSRHRRD